MGRGGNGNKETSLARPRPGIDASRTLAPVTRWTALKEGDSCLTKAQARGLAEKVQAFAARPGGDSSVSSPLAGGDFERIWAQAVTPKNGTVLNDRKGELDVVVSGLTDHQAAKVGWECKLENNAKRQDVPVLASVHPTDLGELDQDPAALGATVLSALGQRHRNYCELHSIVDSRLVFLWGQPAQGRMVLWQEPYYPDEVDPGAFSWQRMPGSLIAKTPVGQPVFAWYPRGHQFKYYARPPSNPELVIELPRTSLDDRAYARAINEALGLAA